MNFSHVQSEDSSLLMENTKLTCKEHKILTSVKTQSPLPENTKALIQNPIAPVETTKERMISLLWLGPVDPVSTDDVRRR